MTTEVLESTVPRVADAVLELQGLAKRFGQVLAVDHVDLAVSDGESIALLGPSGSGKSTMLGLIAGFHAPSAGRVLLRGQDISRLPPAARNIGVVFQHYALFPHLTVEDNVAYGLKMRGWKRPDRRRRAAEMLEIVGLGGYGARMPRQLSGGQQQRVALARALAFEPSVLLLDEPLGALDREIRFQMQSEIRRVHRELGTTMIHVTHDKEEALALGDRIVIMRDGKLVSAATPQQLFASPGTAFVASFFCSYNMIPAEVLTSDSSVFVLVDQRQVVLAGTSFPPGTASGALAIPPTALRLGRAPGADHFELEVEVADVLYLGDLTEVTGRHRGGVTILARIPSSTAAALAIGAMTALHVPLTSLILVPD
jgi:ABC-type Fe3+/spermidine/putrescine transport system ATPase subunit